MPKLDEKKYPTEVAQILDIPKEEYDKRKDDDKDFLALKQEHSGMVMQKAIQSSKEESKKETSKQKQKMRQQQ